MRFILVGFACAFLYRVSVNACALVRLRYYENKYSEYRSCKNLDFIEMSVLAVPLFRAAGLADSKVPCVQPVGYGKVFEGCVSVFENLCADRPEISTRVLEYFPKARGVFKHRLFQSFSPLFWIDCVIFLPRSIFQYLGMSGDSIVSKLFQLLYWLVAPALLIFRDEINQYIISLFS